MYGFSVKIGMSRTSGSMIYTESLIRLLGFSSQDTKSNIFNCLNNLYLVICISVIGFDLS